MNNDWKSRLGVVFSTNENFSYQKEEKEEIQTLPNEKQTLKIQIDRRNRGGKTVTLITGFVGTDEDLKTLAKNLKNRLGIGGAAKDGEIILQGDFREKVSEILQNDGYKIKRIN